MANAYFRSFIRNIKTNATLSQNSAVIMQRDILFTDTDVGVMNYYNCNKNT